DRRKGFDVLFEAWSLLWRTGWDGLLLVVGAGEELPVWEQRAAGLGESIRFLGFRKDVPRILAAGDLLVSPTRYEAYGLGVHEALCAGLPALVSRSAGVAEQYPTELQPLLLSDPENASSLAESLRQWRKDPEVWRSRVTPT